MTNPLKKSEQQREADAATLAQLLRLAMQEINTPAHKERMAFLAAERRSKYLASIDAGFTPQEALELCTK